METFSKWLTWQIVALIGLALAAFAAIAVFAPPEVRTLLFGAEGLVATLVAYWLRSPRDRRPGGVEARRPAPARRRPWEAPGYNEEDPTNPESPLAIDRRDRPPGDSARPRSRREGSADVLEVGAFVGVVVIAALVASLAAGCEGPPSVARRSVEVATVVVMDADRLAAERYTAAANDAYDASSTLAEYRERMGPHDALELALRVAQSTVLAADAALDAWREGGAERWPALAACVVVALGDVQRALGAVGLRAPPELESALTMAAGFALAACPGSGLPGEV